MTGNVNAMSEEREAERRAGEKRREKKRPISGNVAAINRPERTSDLSNEGICANELKVLVR